jgi:hypothetical protein
MDLDGCRCGHEQMKMDIGRHGYEYIGGDRLRSQKPGHKGGGVWKVNLPPPLPPHTLGVQNLTLPFPLAATGRSGT